MIDLFNQLKIYDIKEKYNDPNELVKFIAKIYNIKMDNLESDYPSPLFNIVIARQNIARQNIERQNIVFSPPTSVFSILDKNTFKEYLINIYDGIEERNIDEMIDSVYELEKKLFNKKIKNNEEEEEREKYTEKIDNEEEEEEGKYTKRNDNEEEEEYTENNDNEEEEEEEEEYTENENKNNISIDFYDINTIKNNNYPNINWVLCIEEILSSIGENNTINENTNFFFNDLDYFKNLNQLINEIDGKTLLYYFEMVIISNYYTYLPDNLKTYFSNENEIEEYCLYTVGQTMNIAIGRYYAKKYFQDSTKQNTEKIIEYIKQSMINRLSKLDWLDNETIKHAHEKIATMNEDIGYSENLIKPEYIYERYKDFEIFDDDFLNNIASSTKFSKKTKLESHITNFLKFSPQSINAEYVITQNTISVTAGFLQPPYFYSGIPNYINYGNLGAVIGHELTHAFDTHSLQYDRSKNNGIPWTTNDITEYEKRTECFINQYNDFYIEDNEGEKHYVNGKKTLDENLADNGGLIRGYEAWKLSLMEDPETVKKENQQLPGLTHYTLDQLFFISYGYISCENINNNKNVLNYILNDQHSPKFARVNAVLSNSKEFAKAFNCPVKSKMNPEKKCELW